MTNARWVRILETGAIVLLHEKCDCCGVNNAPFGVGFKGRNNWQGKASKGRWFCLKCWKGKCYENTGECGCNTKADKKQDGELGNSNAIGGVGAGVLPDGRRRCIESS